MSKAKLNRKDYIFEKKKGETLTKVPGQINGLDFLISNLEDCEVYIMDHTAQIFVDDCKNCTIYIGPVESSLFVRDCENLKISAACSQYRVSDSKNIDSCIYSHTDPTIENCSNVRFGPYNFAYPLQDEHFEKAKLDPKSNKWSQVFDFNENKENPNWSILPPAEFPGPVQKTIENMSDPSNPVEYNNEYEGGTIDEPIVVGTQEQGGADDQGMHAYGIQTGAEQAEEDFFGSGQQNTEQNYGHVQQQGNDGYDDFFGSQPQGGAEAQYSGSPAQPYGGSPTQNFGSAPIAGGYGGNMYDANYDPEEEERLERLRRNEQERIVKLEEKARNEREKKQEKIANAAKELANWHSEREQNIEKKKNINKANSELEAQAKSEEDYKNAWDKVVANIATKEGEYPGTKDVSRFRQSLQNKKLDASKGINPGLTDF